MSTRIIVHFEDLVDRLGELRRRLKEAARYEVAQAVSETLTAATRALICGPPRSRSRYGDAATSWDDPWADGDVTGRSSSDEFGSGPGQGPVPQPHLATALLTGLGAARWSLCRSGQPLPAILIGTAVACVVLIGGDRLAPLIDVCSAAQELFLLPDRRR